MAKNKGGRPCKDFDKEEFEKLCAMQCSRDEICGFFDTSDKTLDAWCKRTYGEGFSATFAKKRSPGKIALRRYQMQLAKKNATMAIFLGKQYLGQAENASININSTSSEDDPLTKALKEEAAAIDALADAEPEEEESEDGDEDANQ